jgi:diguanylate cyclase (GGDEF)-like protein
VRIESRHRQATEAVWTALSAFADGLAFLRPQTRSVAEEDIARLRAAQILTISRYSVAMMTVNVFNGLVLVAALSMRPDATVAYIWFAAMLAYVAPIARRNLRRSRRAPPTTASRSTIRKAILHAAIFGLFWGAVPVLFFDVGRADQLIIACVCVGMLCGGAFALFALPSAVVAYTLPIAVGCVIGVFRDGREPVHYLVAPLLISYILALMRAAISHGRQFAYRVVAQVRAETAARNDPLTGLPNRTAFETALGAAFRRLERYGEPFAIFSVDLDEFKAINDRLGHLAGDQILRQVAGRLAGAMRSREMVARLGGDEFIVLAPELGDSDEAARRASDLTKAFEAPFTLDGVSAPCGVSVGVAVAPIDGKDAASLIGCADEALYRSKRNRQRTVSIHRDRDPREVHDDIAIAQDLNRAVERGELFLEYQTIQALRAERVIACEALVRWRHPRRGLIRPGQFIAIAERSGAIHEIGEWVLARACAEATGWPEEVAIAVNVSPRQILDHSFNRVVETALRETGLAPPRLQIEVAESALFRRKPGVASALERLRDLGVAIVLDDFGTGSSSFDQIHHLPVTGLKIAKSLIAALPVDAKSAAIVHATSQLAHALDLRIAAKGIEDQAQLDFLRLARFDAGQGFIFSHPLTAETTRILLANPPGAARSVA